MKSQFNEEICSSRHTTWYSKEILSHDDVSILYTTKVSIYWILIICVDVENDILFNLVMKACMFITSTIENSKECSIAKIHSNWAWGSLTIGVGWSPTSFSSIGSSFKSQTQWTSQSHAKSTNSTMLYLASTIFLPCQLHIFFNGHNFYTSKIQEKWGACWFDVSFIFDFSLSSSMAKSAF